MISFVASAILIYSGMQYYIASWAIRNFPALHAAAPKLRLAAPLIGACFPLALFWVRRGGLCAESFAYVTYLWLGVSFVWLACAFLGDCFVVAARLAGAGDSIRAAAAWCVPAAATCLCLYALWSAWSPPRVKEIGVPMARLPKSLDGFSLVQVSDVHLGVSVPVSRFERIVSQIDALHPDLVVLTGDLLDPGFHGDEAVEKIGLALKGKQGKFAILGNHEFYHGLEASVECYKRLGARLLRNEVVELPNGLQIAGIDDIRTVHLTRAEVSAVLSKLDPGKPAIFLSHQPLMFDLAAERGVGLMLSGHTHRGQIFPFGLFVRLFYRYVYGLYRQGGATLYVTSGAGQWGPPMRLFAPPEIVKFVLRSPQ